MSDDLMEDLEAAHTLALRVNETRIMLTCGHWSAPSLTLVPNWRELADTPGRGAAGWIGYARTTDGRTLCADDALIEEAAAMRTAHGQRRPFVAYTSADARQITTWTGGVLARVTHSGVSRSGFNRSEVHTWRAVDADGNTWYGRNGGNGETIKLRPCKG